MTIDEAIQHCEEVVKEQEKAAKEWHENQVKKCELIPFAEMDYTHENECVECADEHRQLAAWLKELKAYKLKESRSENPNTCGDAISRQAVLDAFWKLNVELSPTAIWTIQNMIKDVPSVTPQQRTGRWIPVGYDGYADGNPVYDWWECSECGWEHTGDEESLTAFCPNCGARMEVQE